jgi:hypothetical protein
MFGLSFFSSRKSENDRVFGGKHVIDPHCVLGDVQFLGIGMFGLAIIAR